MDKELNRVIETTWHRPIRQVDNISGGLNNQITGGGIRRVSFGDANAPEMIVAKHVPPFDQEQFNLATVLMAAGHRDLAILLSIYPDNEIGPREVECYQFINRLGLQIAPQLYAHQVDGSGVWLFMEDVSLATCLTEVSKDLLFDQVAAILPQLAAFHGRFVGQKSTILSIQHIGQWWLKPNSDFASPDVAKYSLKHMAKYITNAESLSMLHMVVNNRPKIYEYYNSSPLNTLIHWDVNPGNVFIKDGHLQLIDWQLASWGIPHWDLAQLLVNSSRVLTDSQIDHLIDTYCGFLATSLGDSEKASFDREEFESVLNLVVADYSFRSSIGVLLGADFEGSELAQCLRWIDRTSLSIRRLLEPVIR